MQKRANRKKIDKYLLLCVSLLCLSGLCAAGCGKRNVDYIGDEQESTDVSENLSAGDNAEPSLWEESFAIDRENGESVTVKIRAAYGSGPDTSQVIGVRRVKLDESAKDKIAKAALGDGASLADGVYTGDRNGVPYQMRIGERRISLYSADMTQIAPEELKDALEIHLDANSGTNGCELSEEEAVKIAEQFLEELGFSDRTFYGSRTLVWTGYMESLGENSWMTQGAQNGYVLYFEQTLHGESIIQLAGDTNTNDFWLWQEGDEYDGIYDTKMHTVICVDSNGIVAADIWNIYEITSIKEDISLLPVDTVREILRKEITELSDYVLEASGNMLYYWGLNSDYCLLWDETGEQGSYVPVWNLMGGQQDLAAITVNAIDGSIVTWEQKNQNAIHYVSEDPAAED